MAAVIAACVLAAGASRRFGSTKQLERVDGESWVRRTARLAREAGCSPVLVVTGAAGERVAAELDGVPGVRPVHHPGWERGMGSSIAAGVDALGDDPSCDGILFLTCDQLELDAGILARLLAAFDGEPGRIVACAYAGTVGVPALFGRDWFGKLRALDGDRGAKPLLFEGEATRIDVEWAAGEADRDRKRGPGG